MKDIDWAQDPMNGWQQKYFNIPYLAMMMGGWRDRPQSKMFMKLFRYIDGANAGNTKIPMTAPVTTDHFSLSPLSSNLENQGMCFWLGAKYALEDAPVPTADDVIVNQVQERRVYVK